MHPAFSVIFFTVTSGAGYGLISLLSLFQFSHYGIFLDKSTFFITAAIAISLFTMGLISSTFHLANPKNAWRAFMRFRTSWLAREGLLAILFYPLIFLYLYLTYIDFQIENFILMQFLSFIIFTFAVVIIYCTGMIYACLKTIPQWNTFWTPINYISIGIFLGGLIFFFILDLYNYEVSLYKFYLLLFIVLAFVLKALYYFSIRTPRHNIGQATNAAIKLKDTKVRLLDVGHTGGTFLTDEFGYKVAEKKLFRVKLFSMIGGFLIPFLLIYIHSFIYESLVICFMAIFLAFLGMVAERWLFFAQAKHVVNLYHGSQQV
ncbi:MAG: dimethyl sulfoxide reductase anchor subunit family protein [Gammaproteobacteria bacterium]|tara:strand:+ start:3794 stop:4747 length:954 start_codon:yes stop_codon:yes gene_type:complete